jgi:hypothetical protein
VQTGQAFVDLLNAKEAKPKHWHRLIPELQADSWRLHGGPCKGAAEGLQKLIGMWIDSGYQPNGIELPGQRSCKDWKEDELVNTPFRIAPNLGNLAVRRTHESITARDTATVFLDDGTVMVLPTILGSVAEGTLLVMAWVHFWQHFRLSIMRCKLCGTFILPQRVRAPYFHGYKCRKCRVEDSSSKRHGASKKDKYDAWFPLAVEGLSAWNGPRSKYHRACLLFVTEYVNDRVPIEHRIKTNTISRRFIEIIRAAGGENHAKSKPAYESAFSGTAQPDAQTLKRKRNAR